MNFQSHWDNVESLSYADPIVPLDLMAREVFMDSRCREVRQGMTVTDSRYGSGTVLGLLNPVQSVQSPRALVSFMDKVACVEIRNLS